MGSIMGLALEISWEVVNCDNIDVMWPEAPVSMIQSDESEKGTELQGWGENYQQDWPMGWCWVIEVPLTDDIGQQKAL